jgi:hypothetical protein
MWLHCTGNAAAMSYTTCQLNTRTQLQLHVLLKASTVNALLPAHLANCQLEKRTQVQTIHWHQALACRSSSCRHCMPASLSFWDL